MRFFMAIVVAFATLVGAGCVGEVDEETLGEAGQLVEVDLAPETVPDPYVVPGYEPPSEYEAQSNLAGDDAAIQSWGVRWTCDGWDNQVNNGYAWPFGGYYPTVEVFAFSKDEAVKVANSGWYVQYMRRSSYTMCSQEVDASTVPVHSFYCYERLYDGSGPYMPLDNIIATHVDAAVTAYKRWRLIVMHQPVFGNVQCHYQKPNGADVPWCGPIGDDPIYENCAEQSE